MEWLIWCVEQVPASVSVTVGLVLWLMSCFIAINLAFGKDSLFLYKQLEYAVGPIPAAILFHVGWFFWPIGLLCAYGTLYITVLTGYGWKKVWHNVYRRLKKTALWFMCATIGITACYVLYVALL